MLIIHPSIFNFAYSHITGCPRVNIECNRTSRSRLVEYGRFDRMADESLFEFLHMEIVSHIFNEQQSSKGEMDNKAYDVKKLVAYMSQDRFALQEYLKTESQQQGSKVKTGSSINVGSPN
ncbi:hypothetical protein ATANTOWER_022833 [Ataeniobius toweri]|uniref:Uncharacterized protein n=1 Tax=Ataeniobius toweri TaxID=208326 RepID=A0ABU7A302_9TELE|nr:hypothetical protein [Ataeniobius toweri]